MLVGRCVAGKTGVAVHHQVVAVLARQPRPDAVELGRQRPDAVALLDTQIGDAGEAYRRRIERRQHGDRRHRVLHLRPLDHCWQVRKLRDYRRRRGVGLGEGAGGDAEIDPAAGQRLGGPEIGGGGRVRLDGEIGGAVAGRRRPASCWPRRSSTAAPKARIAASVRFT